MLLLQNSISLIAYNWILITIQWTFIVWSSVADPDTSDPYVFWAFWIWIRILQSSSKNGKKNLDSYGTVLWLLFDFLWQDPDSLVSGMDPRIRIHTKMSWIRNTARSKFLERFFCFLLFEGTFTSFLDPQHWSGDGSMSAVTPAWCLWGRRAAPARTGCSARPRTRHPGSARNPTRKQNKIKLDYCAIYHKLWDRNQSQATMREQTDGEY